MLTELHIDDLGVIERLRLVLGPGLTALTGETGAGKTMLVEAIELLVGGRADASMVRPGATEARVDGRFVLGTGPDAVETVLTRVVPVSGRSRAYVDGRLATAASLAAIAERVVDLHGQHAHQSLLSAGAQREALDAFGRIDLEPLRLARARVTELDAALAALGGDERARAREIDLLRFQVTELDAAGIDDADEDASLEADEELLADAVAHREAGAAALAALTDDGAGRDGLGAASSAIGDRGPYQAVAARLAGLLAELDDVVSELRGTVESIEEDPQRLAEVRERRTILRDLCRKYGDDLAEVMAFHRSAEERLRELVGFEARAARLEAERDEAMTAALDAARVVGAARRAAAPALAEAVAQRLRALAMPHASVSISVSDADRDADATSPSRAGDGPGDRVQFLLAANPGSPLLPLARVASGGELARAMLALRLALGAERVDDVAGPDPRDVERTLVFDEVDAGIGGAAAVAVGEALADLARRHQVLVVTHLPQVAALADAHVAVAKQVDAGTTTATATPLSADERVDEVARMLSGAPTEAARVHARELLER